MLPVVISWLSVLQACCHIEAWLWCFNGWLILIPRVRHFYFRWCWTLYKAANNPGGIFSMLPVIVAISVAAILRLDYDDWQNGFNGWLHFDRIRQTFLLPVMLNIVQSWKQPWWNLLPSFSCTLSPSFTVLRQAGQCSNSGFSWSFLQSSQSGKTGMGLGLLAWLATQRSLHSWHILPCLPSGTSLNPDNHWRTPCHSLAAHSRWSSPPMASSRCTRTAFLDSFCIYESPQFWTAITGVFPPRWPP